MREEFSRGTDIVSTSVADFGEEFGIDAPTATILGALLIVFIATLPLRFLRLAIAKGREARRGAQDRKARSCTQCGALDSYSLIDRQETSMQPMTRTKTKDGRTVDTLNFIRFEVETLRECSNCGHRIRHHGTEDYRVDANGKRTRIFF